MASGAWDSWRQTQPVKTEKKGALSAFPCPLSPSALPSGPTFSLVTFWLLIYLRNLSCWTLISLCKFNFRWALPFITTYLHILTVSLHSSWDTCPFSHLLEHFLCLILTWNSLFIHVGLLLPLLGVFLVGMDSSWDQRRWSSRMGQKCMEIS